MPTYITPTGERIAYDRDGTVGFWYCTNAGGITVMGAGGADLRQMNSETDLIVPSIHTSPIFVPDAGATIAGVIFADNRDLTEICVVFQNGGPFPTNVSVEASHNTTTGQDGVWTSLGAVTNFSNPTSPNYRSTNLQAMTASAYKAYRVNSFGTLVHDPLRLENFHLYGAPTAGQNPDSLRIWQPAVNAEETAVIDFGDVVRGSTQTATFRVHNLSATKKAWGITVSCEALTDAAPSTVNQMQLSLDNLTFGSFVNLGNLAAGATSPLIYLRNSVLSSAETGVWAVRAVAVPTSFA